MGRRNAEVIAELLRTGTPLSEPDIAYLAQLIVGAGEQLRRRWLERPELSAGEVKAGFAAAIGGAIAGVART